MYEEHPSFFPPPNGARLWRYMGFTKFVSLLDREALFFSSAAMLGDPFEGSDSSVGHRLRALSYLRQGAEPNEIPELLELTSRSNEQIRNHVLVSCWHESEHESEAMWKLYATDAGIAVRTTFDSLSRSLVGETGFHIGRINYIDYENDLINHDGNAFPKFLHKRKSFEHEREVRVACLHFSPDYDYVGAYFPVDLSVLIEGIVVAPFAPDWFVELVGHVSTKYGLEASVSKSQLTAEPLW